MMGQVKVIAHGVIVRRGTREELAAQDAAIDAAVRAGGWAPEEAGAQAPIRLELGLIVWSGGTAAQVADYFRAVDAGPGGGGRPAAAFLPVARAILRAAGRPEE